MINWFAILLVVIGTLIGAVGSVFMKKGAVKFNFNPLDQLRNTNLQAGMVLFFISAIVYIYGLSLERLSLIYPLTSLTYLWVAFLSARFLGEKMSPRKWLGILLIVIGIFMITYFAG